MVRAGNFRGGLCCLMLAGILGGVCASTASASQLIDRNASDLTLQLNGSGEALLTYRAAGKLRHVLAWGAVNALPPQAGMRQTKLRLDYSGGYEKYFKENPAAQALAQQYARIKGTPGYLANPVVKKLQQAQQAADSTGRPRSTAAAARTTARARLAVVECKAPDGSYWAVQEWQRELPDYGLAPTPAEAAGRFASPTGPAPYPSSRCRPTGPTAGGITSSATSATTASRCSASARPRREPPRQLRPQRLHRHLQLRVRLRLAA